MKIDDKAPEAAAADAASADYITVVENGQLKRACKALTPEQREQIVELTEERARDALPDYFEHKRKAPKKPAGEPPPTTREEEAAATVYYLHGGERPASADRFTGYDIEKNRLIDPALESWWKSGGQKWYLEDRALKDEYGNIRKRIIDEALEPFDLYNPDYSIPTENIPLYSEIVAAVAETMNRVADEMEAEAKAKRSAAIKAGLAKKRETENRTRELEAAATRELFSPTSVLMANEALINAIFGLSVYGSEYDPLTRIIKWQLPAGTITLKGGDFKSLTTNARKLWDAGVLYLTKHNERHTKDPNTEIRLDIYETAAARGVDVSTPRKFKKFADDLREDIKQFQPYSIHFDPKMKKSAGVNYADTGFLTKSVKVENGILLFWIEPVMAQVLLTAGYSAYPPILQRIEGSNPNAYPLARYICIHNSMKSNVIAGTANTLRVKSLLNAAPKIPTFENLEFDDNNARAWKRLIKAPLEAAMALIVEVGYIKRWQYRDPETGITYTAKQAEALTATEYRRMMVDFTLMPDKMKEAREQDWIAQHNAREAQKALETAAGTAARKPRKRAPKRAKKADS